MACEVTVKDIQNLIRNRVKDKFDSVKFTKYSDRLAGFIPMMPAIHLRMYYMVK